VLSVLLDKPNYALTRVTASIANFYIFIDMPTCISNVIDNDMKYLGLFPSKKKKKILSSTI
jgi:hypothetical protein